jgi:HPt (histidine-containing phosphotransfer) domain-containing protein
VQQQPSLCHKDDFADAAPVDLAFLRRFTRSDRTLEREVLQLFVAEAPNLIEALRRADTPKAWHDAAHTLKGASAAIGANKIARRAQAAEEVADNPGAWPQLLISLRGEMADVCAYLTAGAAR